MGIIDFFRRTFSSDAAYPTDLPVAAPSVTNVGEPKPKTRDDILEDLLLKRDAEIETAEREYQEAMAGLEAVEQDKRAAKKGSITGRRTRKVNAAKKQCEEQVAWYQARWTQRDQERVERDARIDETLRQSREQREADDAKQTSERLEQSKRAIFDLWARSSAVEHLQRVVCPHCQSAGSVYRKMTTKVTKMRVNSMVGRALGVGANTTTDVIEMRCKNCWMEWEL